MNDSRLAGIGLTTLGAWLLWWPVGVILGYVYDVSAGRAGLEAPNPVTFTTAAGLVAAALILTVGIKLLKRRDT